ncbi:PREDICTED: AT-rich interactive domain-containing protein 5-like [Tarenaya hassleriana]|uniref:AT-rich interactive domain-containing protein 5-like n=1 Tax=Tarenaya hassleriana TaxID=28532 RepID=UPI00053C54B1|nr:PREDICTED: AT-rich interactive domain-containing protein 5-like [Tarenaya hassleriana]
MADTEMQEQDVASGVDAGPIETKDPKQEPAGPEKDQNPSENPHSPVPEDNTLTLGSDVHFADAIVDNETGADEKVGGQASVDGKNADLSEKKSIGDDHEPEEAKPEELTPPEVEHSTPDAGGESTKKWKTWLLTGSEVREADEAGTPEEQEAFIKDVESFHREHFLEFKAPKFYGQPLNCLKLWRAVIKLGGYDVVTSSKLWRQVGESFHPPKTCTTVSWTFRIFYEKALLEYEKFLRQHGQLNLPGSVFGPSSGVEKEVISHQGSGSGRARRDSATRAMQGWHAQRLLGSGEDKGLNSTPKQKNLKSIGVQKHKTPTSMDLVVSHEGDKQLVAEVIDVGPPADWVKINVRETKDCFEIYALVPGLLREEVRVQSDPAGRLVITGQPEQLENPWGITPFKKIVNLPARIDPLHTSAVVSLHGRLFIRVPFEQ